MIHYCLRSLYLGLKTEPMQLSKFRQKLNTEAAEDENYLFAAAFACPQSTWSCCYTFVQFLTSLCPICSHRFKTLISTASVCCDQSYFHTICRSITMFLHFLLTQAYPEPKSCIMLVLFTNAQTQHVRNEELMLQTLNIVYSFYFCNNSSSKVLKQISQYIYNIVTTDKHFSITDHWNIYKYLILVSVGGIGAISNTSTT